MEPRAGEQHKRRITAQETHAMLTGNIVINGIDDKQLRTLLTVKIEHEGSLIFSPNQLQPLPQPQRPGQPQPQPQNHEQLYNNAIVIWNSEAGLKAVKELLYVLTEKAPAEKAA
jgi:hypothetical protein